MWQLILAALAKLWWDVRSEQKARENTARFWSAIEAAARRHGVRPDVIAGIVQKESAGNPNAVGAGKYFGLGQIALETARGYGFNGTARQLMEPATNLDYVARLLDALVNLFHGDYTLAVSAYNAGAYRLTHDWDSVPRNMAYVSKVLRYATQFSVWARLPGDIPGPVVV